MNPEGPRASAGPQDPNWIETVLPTNQSRAVLLLGSLLTLSCSAQAPSPAGSRAAASSEEELEQEGDEGEEEGEQGEEGDGAEQTVAVAQLPAAVASSAAPYFATLDGCKATREDDEGYVLFEIEGQDKGNPVVTVSLTEEGLVLEIERLLSASDLPGPATAALASQAPGARTERAEAVEKRSFEVVLSRDGRRIPVVVDAAGRIEDQAESGEEDEGQGVHDGGR